jgi:cell division protein FtsI/penicillin-binding protein 2
MPADVAEQVTAMMEQTVTSGTAHRIFAERGMRVPGAVGKTGSLADKRPFRDYTWFVGFAPKDAPKIAVAAVIVNDPLWRIRATWLGREAMRLYLDRKEPAAPALRDRPTVAIPVR